ncbi:MAG: inorganic phosphate transporter [Bacteroidia bacterium]|jgi:PiT family inorganic phosphate transporter
MNSATSAATGLPAQTHASRPRLDHKPGPVTAIVFIGLLAAGLLFAAYSLVSDVNEAGARTTTYLPYMLLSVALLIALGFEFVNGFHDTANAVATVMYTHSLPPNVAVVRSGLCNFIGVLVSSGAVAFGIISLLPVELILQVGSGAGFAMVFALLIAAIVWSLGTWWLGLPASSSHTLIGSIVGVGIAYALMHGRGGTSGVDWAQATKVGYSLLLSPLIGFGCAALLLLALRAFVKNRALYEAPVDQMTQFVAVAQVTQQALLKNTTTAAPADARQAVFDYVRTQAPAPDTLAALAALTGSIGGRVKAYGALSKVPAEAVANVRNDMYLASEAIRFLDKDASVTLDADSKANLKAFKKQIDDATTFIPLWVKVAVAIALGLGTMAGWKRIVVTVGEKIGKTHLTYAQGASAELVAMVTIGAADIYGLPVSTTHVLASGVAGTMAANRSGLQLSTLRNLAMAWVLTMPAAIVLSGSLYWLFVHVF